MAICNANQLLSDGCQFEGLSDYDLQLVQTQLIANWIQLALPATDISASGVLSRSCGSGISDLNALSSQDLRAIRLSILCDAASIPAPPQDPDVTAFITCSGITNTIQVQAIQQLVADLKNDGLWLMMDAVYPFVGGNATAHSCNLRNPATFSIIWHGTVTHDANGITGDGATGFGDTQFNPATAAGQFSLNSSSMGVYCRTASPAAGSIMGAWQGVGSQTNTRMFTAPFEIVGFSHDGVFLVPASTMHGFVAGVRTAAGSMTGYSPSNTVTDTSYSATNLVNLSLYILASRQNAALDGPTNANFAFAFIGAGFSGAQVAQLQTIITNFETTLGRV